MTIRLAKKIAPILLLALSILVLVPTAPPRAGAAPDHEVAAGQFYSQTGGGSGAGYHVRDDGRDPAGNVLRFWGEFQRLGAVDTLGYPVSRRFTGAGGFVYQAFQRGVLQWRPESGAALLANTFDWLQQAGRDEWLNELGVPPPIADDGSGGDWHKAKETRLGWLTEPRIKEKFLADPTGAKRGWTVDDALTVYGLPMSRPERRGPFIIQRFQRVAFQLWVEAVPGMPSPGTVVGVLGGDMLKQAGLVPAEAAAPELPGGEQASDTREVRGIYVSYNAAGASKYLERVLDLAGTTEINAVVVDVKGDRGHTTYPSDVPLAKLESRPIVKDAPALAGQFRQRGLYTIARIVTFKDDVLAVRRPDLAVIDSRTGKPWRDGEGLGWTNPFLEEVWDYNVALAVEAARRGFDEVQFDYIRFPAGAGVAAADFGRPVTPASRTAAINGFLARARAALRPLGVKMSADLFGYTTWYQDDNAIGQRLEDMARHLDVVSPMLYPSTFGNGIPGYRPGVAYPYEIVSQSVRRAVERLKGSSVVVRPWLQDFPDHAYDRRPYTAKEVVAQIRGARDGGAAGWLLWDPRVTYTKEALGPK